MSASDRSAVRRTGRILTGFGALVVLCALVVGAPIALLAFAGNPLPDHLPTFAEVGTALTSRDDGQLFLRALALAGWFGWATFTFSVLVELGAQTLRRPAPKLPGMSRQQKAAAALVGSVALILVASPAAASAAAVYGTPAYASPDAAAVATLAAPNRPSATHDTAVPLTRTGFTAPGDSPADEEATPMYRVARGDYLGTVAERYLDEFGDYRQLAKLNKLDDPDRIRPGQLLRLPSEAADQGARRHATGKLVGQPAAPKPPAPRPAPEQTAPEQTAPEREAPEQGAPERTAPERVETTPRSGTESAGQAPTMTVGAARAGDTDGVNRPLAVSAVLAVASIVGAQIGAVLGLRRRPATAGAAPRLATSSRTPRTRTPATRYNRAAIGSGTVARDGRAASRGDSGVARDGRAASRDGGGVAREGRAASPDGGGVARGGSAVARGSGIAPTGSTAPASRGTPPTGGPSWVGDDAWAGDSAEGQLFASGHDLDSVPDGPSVGRHRRS
ncbi:LysM repeat protein [Micromonospora profundi]|nr:LysM repeat protein [Micromonospora profundi]